MSADSARVGMVRGGVKAGWIGPPRGRTRALDDQHPKPYTLNPLIKMIQTKDFVKMIQTKDFV